MFVFTIIAIVCVFLFLVIKGCGAKAVSVADLEVHFESFVDSMADGALMFIEIPKTEMFLQFAVYRDSSTPVLHFGFPDAPWSRDFFPDVYQELVDRGEKVEITQTDSEECPRFVEVNYDLSSKECTTMMSNLARIVLGVLHSRDAKLRVKFKGDLLPKDDAIARFKARKGIT